MQYGNVETAYGTVNIKPIDSPFRYLVDILVDGNLLVEKWQSNGWALNTEYFAEVLHLLRDDLTYTTIVDECLAVPAKPDKRDLTAIKRLCTAFVKLLYPNATCKDDIPADEFIKYCLEPAKEMRGVIKKQLCIIDPKEFNVPGKKDIPDIQYNYM